MDSSSRAAAIVLLVLAIVLLAVPVTGSIDDSYNGRTIHVARGDTLSVRLTEKSPDQTWHFDGSDHFSVTSDTAPGTYPGKHDFRMKALATGELGFKKVDIRDGYVVGRFTVRVVTDRGKPEET